MYNQWFFIYIYRVVQQPPQSFLEHFYYPKKKLHIIQHSLLSPLTKATNFGLYRFTYSAYFI